MVTKAQAMECDTFHENGCSVTVGPRGGVTVNIREWRRNGATKTWVTRPDEYRVPVKYGMRSYDSITQYDGERVHVADECPVREWYDKAAKYPDGSLLPGTYPRDFR